jgi:hypothetical protein
MPWNMCREPNFSRLINNSTMPHFFAPKILFAVLICCPK